MFQICLTPWKNNVINHSVSNCMKSLLIMSSKSTWKQRSSVILISLFFRIKLFKVIHLVERKISWNFFWIFLTNERSNECWAQEKSPALKNSWLCAYSWFLSNMFKFLVISFVYLANHLTSIRTRLYIFCISPMQCQHNSPQALF